MFPLQQDKILFESEDDFCDNSRVLYDYIKNNLEDKRLVWLCHSKRTLKRLNHKHPDTEFVHHNYHFENVRSAWHIATAKYIFFTHGISQMTRRRRDQCIINLWHGIAIKGVKKLQHDDNPVYSYLLSLGDSNRINQSKFLGCGIDKVIPLGYPRNDLLINETGDGSENPFIHDNTIRRVIIWMPTFRSSINSALSETSVDTLTGLPLLDSYDKVESFDEFLARNKIKMIIKIHHLQTDKPIFKETFRNILFLSDHEIQDRDLQLYSVLAKTDALLTDYSSVSIDYLLTDKPMGFILDDYAEYEKSRGKFLFKNTLDILAGKHIYTIKDLEDFCLNPDSPVEKEHRKKIRAMMYDKPDNQSCSRICDFCGL